MVIFYLLSEALAQSRSFRTLPRIVLWLFDLVILEEVHQVTLMRLKGLLSSKLMHTKFLDDLKDVNLFVKLALGALIEEIAPLLFRLEAAAAFLVKAP